MSKITVFKTVYWNDGFLEKTGKVKQIIKDHALIESKSGNYMVLISVLSLKPIKVASSNPQKIIKSASLNKGE